MCRLITHALQRVCRWKRGVMIVGNFGRNLARRSAAVTPTVTPGRRWWPSTWLARNVWRRCSLDCTRTRSARGRFPPICCSTTNSRTRRPRTWRSNLPSRYSTRTPTRSTKHSSRSTRTAKTRCGTASRSSISRAWITVRFCRPTTI